MQKNLLKSLFVLNLVIIIYFWYQGSAFFIKERTVGGELIAFGRLSGLMLEYLILTQLVLIGRIRWIESRFGHNEMTFLHRTIGTYIIILLFAHPILLSVGWGITTESGYWQQFLSFLNNWDDVFTALVGLIVFTATIILSFTMIRKKLRYERWHFTHLFMYAGIALAFQHQTNTGDLSNGSAYYYWMALNFLVFGLMLLYRFLKPFWSFYEHRFQIEKIVPESNDVSSIYVTGKNLDKFDFKAGQFAEVMFLKKGLFTPHPFSFSTAPNGKYLRFTVKALGDFTNRIKELTPGTKIIIDGPLGNFTEEVCKTGKFLFIAGGVGITPIISIIESLNNKNKLKDACLFYCVRSSAQIPFRDVLEKLPIKTFYVVSDFGGGGASNNYISGQIDIKKISELCPEFKNNDIYFCGPPKMGESILKDIRDSGVPKKQIHYERFAF